MEATRRLGFEYDTINQRIRFFYARSDSSDPAFELRNEAEILNFLFIAKCVEDAFKRSKPDKEDV